MATGNLPLTGVSDLPRATVIFPGEHWSDKKASEAIMPGEAVVLGSAGVRKAVIADVQSKRLALGLRCVDHPDTNNGPNELGPNQIRNQPMAVGDWVHRYYSGAFALTLVEPAVYETGDLIGWKPAGARPAGIAGAGSWGKVAAEADALFEVQLWRKVNVANEGILNVRSLRGQF